MFTYVVTSIVILKSTFASISIIRLAKK
jgi:hypothetical protein